MKKSLPLAAVFLCCITWSFAQQLAAPQFSEEFLPYEYARENFDRSMLAPSRANCPNDTVYYTWQKNVKPGYVLPFNLADTIGYPRTLTQWFEAPQAISVSGMRFVVRANPGQSQNITLSIYNAGPDSLPLGPALASANMTVNDQLTWRTINFPSPVTVNGPYCLGISNSATTLANRVQVFSNFQNSDYPADSLSGRGENLAGGDWVGTGLGWNKLKTLYASVNAVVDVDFIMVPIVNYQVTADFTAIPANPCIGTQVTLNNNSSPVLMSRFYNVSTYFKHFHNITDETFWWTLPTGPYVGTNATISSGVAGPVNAELDAFLEGWTMYCGDFVAKQVNFVNQTDASFTYANTSYCEGATTNPSPILGPNSSAGTFSSTTGLAISPTTGVINLQNSTQGTYTVTNTIAATGSCPQSTHTYNVTILPKPIVSMSALPVTVVCPDYPTFQLTGGAPSGGIYTVNGNNATSFNPSTAAVGNYTIVYHYQDANGCSGSSQAQNLEMKALDEASFNYDSNSFCIGASNPVAGTLPGSSGTFSSSAGLVFANSSTGEIDLSNSNAGSYTITFNTNGSCPNSSSIQITISQPPTVTLPISNLTLCHTANPIPLVGGLPGGGTYTVNGVAATTFTPSLGNVGDNIVVYSYTDVTTGCSGSESATITIEDCTGIEDNPALASIKVYPNPTKGRFLVKSQLDAKIVVTDLLGAAVSEGITSTQKPSVEFNLENLSPGIYYVRISTEAGTAVRKVNLVH